LVFSNWRSAQIRLMDRGTPADRLKEMSVRNLNGKLIPLAALAKISTQNQPTAIFRVGPWPAILITGSAPPGIKSAEAVKKWLAIATAEHEKLKIAPEYEAVNLTTIGQ